MEWFLNEGENVKAHLSILEDKHRCHGEHHRSHAHRVIKQHGSNLGQKEAITHQHLHIVNRTVRYIIDDHVEEVENVAHGIIIGVEARTAEVKPRKHWPDRNQDDKDGQVSVLKDDLSDTETMFSSIF